MILRYLPFCTGQHRTPSGRRTLITLLLFSVIGVGAGDCYGQLRPSLDPSQMAPLVPVASREAMDVTDDLRARLLAPAERPSRHDEIPDPHFGRALFGGTLGAGLGTGLGLLLLHEASRVETEDDWRTTGRRSPEAEVATYATLIGVACIVGGGPLGAVEMGRIERRRTDAYVGAVVGEFVFGVLGYVAANRLHNSPSSRLVGLGAGVAVGSASGAVLVASQQKNTRGLFQQNEGRWTVAPPTVRLYPHLSTRRSPSVHVTLLSLRW